MSWPKEGRSSGSAQQERMMAASPGCTVSGMSSDAPPQPTAPTTWVAALGNFTQDKPARLSEAGPRWARALLTTAGSMCRQFVANTRGVGAGLFVLPDAWQHKVRLELAAPAWGMHRPRAPCSLPTPKAQLQNCTHLRSRKMSVYKQSKTQNGVVADVTLHRADRHADVKWYARDGWKAPPSRLDMTLKLRTRLLVVRLGA